jgi:hypothetical protein
MLKIAIDGSRYAGPAMGSPLSGFGRQAVCPGEAL